MFKFKKVKGFINKLRIYSQGHWDEMASEMDVSCEEAQKLEAELIQRMDRYDPELEPMLHNYVNQVTATSTLAGACLQASGKDVLWYVRTFIL